MLTIKGPVRYQKPAEVPAVPFDVAIEKMSKPKPVAPTESPNYFAAIVRQRAVLIDERERHMREVRRVDNILLGIDRALEILTSGEQAR